MARTHRYSLPLIAWLGCTTAWPIMAFAADVTINDTQVTTRNLNVLAPGGTTAEVTSTGNVTTSAASASINASVQHWTITNSGIISNTNTANNAARAILCANGCTVINTSDGNISSSRAGAQTVYASGGANFTVDNQGTITSAHNAIYSSATYSNITNGGTITAEQNGIQTTTAGEALNTGDIISNASVAVLMGQGGTVENTSTGLLRGAVGGIRVNAGDPTTNEVTNAGRIESTGTGYGIYVLNGGSIENTATGVIDTNSYAIRMDAGDSALNSVINRGQLISATSNGIQVTGGGYIENIAGASIDAGNNGISLSGGVVANNHIVNRGTVHGDSRAVTIGSVATLDNYGTLTSDSNAITASLVGSVINNHGLIQGGAGSVIFMSQGGTIVNEATGVIRSPSLSLHTDGAMHFTNRGSLISNSNGVVIDGDGNAGNTIINSGTITGEWRLSAFNDTVTLETGSTVNGPINGRAGTDSLTLDGHGTLTAEVNEFEVFDINADATGWTTTGTVSMSNGGTVNLNTGRYYLNGSLTADSLATAAGTTLLGSGNFTGNLINNAAIAPGNSIGTLTINGNYTHAAMAVYDLEVAANGTSDLIDVTGTADLQGGTVSVTPLAGNYLLARDYTILTAAGGVNGTFDSASSVNALFDTSLDYDPNNVYLRLTRNDVGFADITSGGVGAAFDAIPDNNPYKQQLMSQNNGIINESLRKMSAAPYPSQAMVLPVVQQKIGDIVGHRLSGGYMNNTAINVGPTALAATLDGIAPAGGDASADMVNLAFDDRATAADRQRLNFLSGGFAPAGDGNYGGWLQGYGAVGKMNDRGNSANWRFAGIAAGVDRQIASDTLAGIALGHARGRTDMDPNEAEARTRLWQVSAYGAHRDGPWQIQGQTGYALARTDAHRTALFAGVPTRLDADYDTHILSARAEGGHDFTFKNTKDRTVVVTPLAGFDYAWARQESFTESGGPGLRFSDDDTTSLRTSLGLRATAHHALENGGYVIPSITVRWRHELADTSANPGATFAAAPAGAPVFGVRGMERARDEADINIGIAYAPTPAQTFYTSYQTTQSSSTNEHGVLLGASFKW